MKKERSEDERREIGERVQAARGAQSLEAAAREAGMSSITLSRIESGQPVREDRLAAALAYVEARRPTPVPGVEQLTDDQLIDELRRRLHGSPTGSEKTSDGPSMTKENSPAPTTFHAGPGTGNRAKREATESQPFRTVGR